MKTLKSIRLVLAAALAVAVGAMSAACTTPGATPSQAQAQAIENACAVDAAVRPTVTALLAIPGLAKAEEIAAVTAARLAIDPVCANPSGNLQANALAAVTGASGQVVAIVAQLQARKAVAAKPEASAP